MLEAMSCNVPVITSNTSSMPEVSEAAHIINFNPEEITQGLIEILQNATYRKSLCDKGLERSKQFSTIWRDYLKLYELIDFEHSKQ
jgi:glycosyltransferase involved in cell wall biosynthesis